MERTVVACLFLLASVGATAVAGEGRIPIWESTTITQSGKYIVTRNIGDETGSTNPRAITIEADGVDIDLNGFTLRAGEPVIYAQDVFSLRIHNGTVVGYEDAIGLSNVTSFVLSRLIVSSSEDGAVWISESDIGIVEDLAIRDNGNGGLGVYAGSKIDIRRNVLTGLFDTALSVDCIGCRITENTATSTGFSPGIVVSGSGNLILDNLASSNVNGAGLSVSGDFNHIEGNVLMQNNVGLELLGDDNVYRGNTARGNGTDFSDIGVNNTSHGDNYMPGQL